MTPRERATIYDVAGRAGVSISTVSLALNKPARVADATRCRIFEAMAALEYQPKTEASMLARRGVGRIAVIAAFSSHPSFYRRLNGIMAASADQDVDIVVFDHPSADTMTSPLLTSLPVRGSVDGIIAMGIPLDSEQFQLRSDVPIVVVDFEHPLTDSITVGDTAGAVIAGQHLLELDCETFAFVGAKQTSTTFPSPRSQRLEGFRQALSTAGATLDDNNVITAFNGKLPDAIDHVAEAIDKLAKPCGVLAYSDSQAAIVIRAGHKLGLSIPDELRIIGFDNSELAEALDLTSVEVPFFDSGRYAFEIMARRLAEPDLPLQHTRLGQKIVARSTTQVAQQQPVTSGRS